MNRRKRGVNMKDLTGTKTFENLQTAFAGESQAHTKYAYYASRAKKDGYEQIADIFTETSLNEKEHAKIWFKLLHGGAVPSTDENLKDAVAGEHYETSEMYVEFAKVAEEEGFELGTGIADIHQFHNRKQANQAFGYLKDLLLRQLIRFKPIQEGNQKQLRILVELQKQLHDRIVLNRLPNFGQFFKPFA